MADETKTINTNNPEEEEELIDEEIMVVETTKDEINGLVVCDGCWLHYIYYKRHIIGTFCSFCIPCNRDLINI